MPPKKAVPPTGDTVPEGEILATEAAARLGLTDQAIGQWASKPRAPVRKAGGHVFVRWPEFARWREQQLASKGKRSASIEKNAERRASADARSAEIAMERGELALARELAESIGMADFDAALARILVRLTAGLRSLPPQFTHLGPEAEAVAEREVERLVVELHAWDEDVIDETDAPAKAEGAE